MSVDTMPTKAFALMAATPSHDLGDDEPATGSTGTTGSAGLRPDDVEPDDLIPSPAGDPRALLAARVLASVALLAAAGLHVRGALTLGLGGPPLAQSHLLLLAAVPAALVGLLLLARDSRWWPVAVLLAGLDLAAILASVYLPLPAVGPFPGLEEPVWLLTKAVSAMADLTVVVLWGIRRVAPPE